MCTRLNWSQYWEFLLEWFRRLRLNCWVNIPTAEASVVILERKQLVYSALWNFGFIFLCCRIAVFCRSAQAVFPSNCHVITVVSQVEQTKPLCQFWLLCNKVSQNRKPCKNGTLFNIPENNSVRYWIHTIKQTRCTNFSNLFFE